MNRSCPVCNSENKEILYTQKFYKNDILLFNEYNVVVCNECGMIYADRIPAQNEFNTYYKNLSKYEFKTSNKQIMYCKDLFEFIQPWVKNKESKILDIGCSNGDLLNEFQKLGYKQCLGIEPSSSCVKYAYENYGVSIFNTNIFDFNTEYKFDFIFLSAILEHIMDLKQIIEKVNSLLTEDGRLFVEVPNIKEFSKYIDTPFQQFSTEHINYWSIRSICNLLKDNFIPIRIEASIKQLSNIVDPSLMLIFQKTKKKTEIKKDVYGKYEVKEYIEKSQQLENQLKEKIQEILKDEGGIIVWGCGTQTLHLLDTGIDYNKVVYFVDSNLRYQGKKIGDKEIKLPEKIKENLPIFISTFAYKDEIIKQIQDMKLENRILSI